MKSMDKIVIYIRLLNEGVDVVRPTYGEFIANNIFRVLPTENYDPEDEEWEFLPGSIVECKRKTSPDGKEALLAVKLHTK